MGRNLRNAFRVLVLLAASLHPPAAAASGSGGVVVEKISAEESQATGLQAGDRLLHWHGVDQEGALASPFDWFEMAAREMPRGPVRLEGVRGKTPFAVTVDAAETRITVRGTLGRPDTAQYTRAVADLAGEQGGRGERALIAVADGKDPRERAWILDRLAALLADGERLDEAAARLHEALDENPDAPARMRAWLLHHLAEIRFAADDLEGAVAAHQEALDLRRAGGADLVTALSLHRLGVLAYVTVDLERAESWWSEALAVRDRLAPGSAITASTCNNLGVVASRHGDSDAAERWYMRALVIRERLFPGSLVVADCYSNLGLEAANRGDLALAETRHRQALALRLELAPDTEAVAATYDNLALVAQARGDLDGAGNWQGRARALWEALAPDSLELATCYNNSGSVAQERGDLEGAARWFTKALELRQRLAPDSPDTAASLNNLGEILASRGDLDGAAAMFERALQRFREVAPGTLEVAVCTTNLAGVAGARGDRAAQRAWLAQSLALCRSLAPGSSVHCDAAWKLAALARDEGKSGEALALFAEAIGALETQQARLGGTPDNLATFRTRYLGLYREQAALLVAQGRGADAFRTLEGSRARALLALLAERDLVARDVPEALDRERRRAGADYGSALAELGALADTEGNAARRIELRRQLDALRLRLEEVRARIKAASPRLSALRYPEPLDVAQAQASLEPGTVALLWMLGERESLLFVLAHDRFRVHTLPLGEQDVGARVRRLRALLQDPATGAAELGAAAAALGPLLAPAAGDLRRAQRLVLSPDGPLWLCPFAVLADPSRPGRPLGASWPLALSASLTVRTQLPADRHDEAVVAFGDPAYGPELAPLPGTRREVQALKHLFPDVRARLGTDATETAVRHETTGRVLHLAAHGLVDEAFPMDSAIALTPDPAEGAHSPAEHDGRLTVWEIFEGLRFEYDLVTLSACETALGRDVAGEGVLGLSRAFHYAGARSVLMTLWSVDDASAAAFMGHFYAALRSGDPRDVALMKAQDRMRADPRTAHPCHWAPFLLSGAP